MEIVFEVFAGFNWLLKFLSYFGILAAVATAFFMVTGGIRKNQSWGLFCLGIWIAMACLFVKSDQTLLVLMGQATFLGYGLYLFFWDSPKDKAKGWSRIFSRVVGALLLTQPLCALWVLALEI